MKAHLGIHHGILYALLLFPFLVEAQPGIHVGNTVDFGGTTVSLNEQNQQRLQQEVNKLYANRDRLNMQLEQLRQLDPFIQPAMKKMGLPVDFRFLVLPLDTAGGYWNLPTALAQQIGLGKTPIVDEAYHPLLTTEAAVAYLARLQSRTANSLRTVVQYVQAEDALKAKELMGDRVYEILDIHSPILWKLLARQFVFNREEPVFRLNRTFVLWAHQQSNSRTLTDIAFQYNLPTDRLQPFDGWLLGPVIPEEGTYPVFIRMLPEEYAAASGRLDNAKQNPPGPDMGFPVLRRMPAINSELNTPITLYEINNFPGIQAQPGDNVITLAFYGKIKVRQFLDYNDLTDRDVVRPGEIYYLGPKARRAKVPFHVVEAGQTMREVAHIYGVQLKHLLRYNDLAPSQPVTEGRVIWFQRPRPKNQPVEYRQVPPRPRLSTPTPEPDSTLKMPIIKADSTELLPINAVITDSLRADSLSRESLVKADSNAIEKLPAVAVLRPKVSLHIVRLGQTYYSISRLYGTTLSQLYTWNNLSERIPLQVGQQLIVGISLKVGVTTNKAVTSTISAARKPVQKMKTIFKIERIPIKPPTPKQLVSRYRYHTVKTGQTVYRVALLNRTTVRQVMRLNNLRNYTIEVGQRLRVR